MSSTRRGTQRAPSDFYPTPKWCVRRILEAVDLPGGQWLEPCIGHGAVVAATAGIRSDVVWTGLDVHASFARPVSVLPPPVRFLAEDFTQWRPAAPLSFDVVITNPPYAIAQAIIERSLSLAPIVVMLLRLNYLASAGRALFMRRHPPDVYVLPNRPSFSGRGTDSIEYAWFVWRPKEARTSGRIQVLPPTDRTERRMDHSRQAGIIASVAIDEE